MKIKLTKIINKVLSLFKVKIIRTKYLTKDNFKEIFVSDVDENKIISIDNLSRLSNNIRGMISSRAGEELFSVAYMQSLSGDVVEIGSFQGKSTFFLGSAVKFSGNGKMFAIDHFKGNVGKEKFYKVRKDDLSDLEDGFKKNIKKAFLENTVTLINQPNDKAANYIKDNTIRLLFIDGDHTAEGIAKDLDLFVNKLKKNAIIAFDDYANTFPGVIEVTNRFIKSHNIKRKYLLGRTLFIQVN
tara:strand:- start:2928 stop:3653 length:726 start_codon:yes stop_codon:yes gene_type:complete